MNDADGDSQVPGATWAMHVIPTVATLDVRAAGAHQRKPGMAQFVVDPLIPSWTRGPYQLTTGIDGIVPIGACRKGDLAYIGRPTGRSGRSSRSRASSRPAASRLRPR